METRKRGRKPLQPSDRKSYHIALRVNAETYEFIDAMRGNLSRSDYIMRCVTGNVPVQVPEINREAWADLGRVGSNINQLARRVNLGDSFPAEIIKSELFNLRLKMMGMSA